MCIVAEARTEGLRPVRQLRRPRGVRSASLNGAEAARSNSQAQPLPVVHSALVARYIQLHDKQASAAAYVGTPLEP